MSTIAVLASCLDPDLRAAVAAARAAGAQGLQIPVESPAASPDMADLSQSGQRELRALLARAGLTLASLRVDLPPRELTDGRGIETAVARLTRAAQLTRALQCPILCVDLATLPIPPRPAPTPAEISPQLAGLILVPKPAATPQPADPPLDPITASRVDSALAHLGTLADRTGILVAFRSDLAPFRALARALDAANCPSFGIDLDPVAAIEEGLPLDAVLAMLGTRVRHVRARDAIAGSPGRTKPAPVGQGSVPWTPLLRELAAASFTGPIAIDSAGLTDPAAAALAGIRHLSLLR